MLECHTCLCMYACTQHLGFIWSCFVLVRAVERSQGRKVLFFFRSFRFIFKINFRPHVVPCYQRTCQHFSPDACACTLVPGIMLGKQTARRDCDSHSISCVQIEGSNNSITAANSLMVEARVQKSRIMQSRPAGNCCPEASLFNIVQVSLGITLRPSSYQLASFP